MKSRQRSAITLFEVTIVILILGVMATVSMPRLSASVQAANVRSCAAAIQSHLAYARSVAMLRGRTVTITFDNVSDSYESSEIGFPDQPGSVLQVNTKRLFDPSIDLVANFDGGVILSFDGEGTPRVGANQLVAGVIDVSAGGVKHRVRVGVPLGTVSSSQINEG